MSAAGFIIRFFPDNMKSLFADVGFHKILHLPGVVALDQTQVEGSGRAMAEFSPTEKNQISHRAQAFIALSTAIQAQMLSTSRV